MDETEENTEAKPSDENESSSEEEENEVFSVEQIVSHKRQNGRYKYRIRWHGYEEDQDTWEPESNLIGEYSQELLHKYKAEHNIDKDDSGANKKRHYEYVSDEDANNAQWLISPDDDRREVRGLYVQDRILDETEKCLTVFQNDPVRLTRSQLKNILPQGGKKDKANESKTDSTPRKRVRKPRVSDTSSADHSKPKKRKVKKIKTPDEPQASSSKQQASRQEVQNEDKPDQAKLVMAKEVQKEVFKLDQCSTPIGKPHPKKPAPVSMVGKDPRQSVGPKSSKEPNLKIPFSSYKIPKKSGATKVVSPQTAKVQKPANNNDIPNKTAFGAQKSAEKQKGFQKPTLDVAINLVQKPMQWRSVQEKIHEKECALPDTRLSLNATLNINPAQLTSYHSLATDCQTLNIEKFSQSAFNDAVLTGKVATVRAVLRNKSHGLDLDQVDGRGRTLLHRLAESNCDQQHSQDEIIDLLVNAGANMSIPENEHSRTPLHSAVHSRRLCHVRKLLQLGSPINTSDARNESPLITALKVNNTELAKILLYAGATYQGAFSSKISLTKSQQKPVLSYQNSLRDCMQRNFRTVIFDVQSFNALSPVYQSPLYETHQLDFTVYNSKHAEISKTFPILMIALIDTSEKRTAVSWDESPIESVHLNGNKLECVQEGNKFFFIAAPFVQQNAFIVTLDRARVQYSKRILTAQVFGIEMNLGF